MQRFSSKVFCAFTRVLLWGGAAGVALPAAGQFVELNVPIDYDTQQGLGQGTGSFYFTDLDPEIGALLNLLVVPPQDIGHQLMAPLVQWQTPLPVNPQDHFLYFYSFDPVNPAFNTDLIALGGQFEAFGFAGAQVQFPDEVSPPLVQQPLPLLPGQDDQMLPWPDPFGGFRYLDPQQDGLLPTMLVGMADPNSLVNERGLLMYGDADPLLPPQPETFLPAAFIDPQLPPQPNGELVYVPVPHVPNQEDCVDLSLVTVEMFDYLREQEAANGIHIEGSTEVVDFVTVRDNVRSWVEADDGFTYVTIVEDFVTTGFYRFPTGTLDPKGIVPFDLLGDYNASGQVEQGDLDLVLQNWGLDTDLSGIPVGWTNDLPFGQIEQTELDGVLQNWGNTPPIDVSNASVPEPAGVALLGLGIGFAVRRRVLR